MELNHAEQIAYFKAALAKTEKSVFELNQKLSKLPAWYKSDLSLHKVKKDDRREFIQIRDDQRNLQFLSSAYKVALVELAELEAHPEAIGNCYLKAVRWINQAKDSTDLIKHYQADPIVNLSTRTENSRLNIRTAKAILKYRDHQVNRQIVKLESLFADKVVTEAVLRNLLYSGCQLPDPKPELNPIIGVMLPFRLETRFFSPTGRMRNWRLQVRLFPDDVSIDRHNPLASVEELTALDNFYKQIDGDLQNPLTEQAWEVFAGSVGGARAVWLTRSFEPQLVDSSYTGFAPPDDVQDDGVRFSRIRGLPDTIELWIAKDGNPAERVKTIALDRDQVANMEIVDFNQADGDRWWNSYEVAKQVGMATEISLGTDYPDNIDVLYAVGLSDETPTQLFQAHRDKGALAVLKLGEATNTVAGEPAVDMQGTLTSWLDMARGHTASGTWEVSQALTGLGEHLEPIQGPATEKPWHVNNALVTSLWFSLWGHSLKDIWGLGPHVHSAGLWASELLYPEGALPPIRVRQQPYGLVVSTSLHEWKAEKKDPPIERVMREPLIHLRKAWADAANKQGTIVGADSDKLLEILGHTPSSDRYVTRQFFSLNIFALLYHSFLNGVSMENLNTWWGEKIAAILQLNVNPQRQYASVGYPQHIKIPLVEPDNLPDGFTWQRAINILKEMRPEVIINSKKVKDAFGGILPNSLLLRLLIHSLTVGMAEVTRARDPKSRFSLEPVYGLKKNPTRLAADAYKFKHVGSSYSPAHELLNRFYDYLDVISSTPLDQLERAFRSVLDSAAYRIDPWVSAYAWRRYKTYSARQANHRLGIYAWVDAPKPGNPGPTEGGLLHAPSEQQCYTSMIIRDKAIYDAEQDRWKMNMDSRSIRDAERLAKEVRAGNHLQEILGREVERILGEIVLIKRMRKMFPLRVENGLKRVCNGQDVLNADKNTLNLPDDKYNKLAPIREALDVYGDLLVAQAVNDVVAGRAEVAGAAMDAAAGLAEPPSLEVIKTQRSGRTATSTVLFCLPVIDPPVTVADSSPTIIADASVAEWLKQQTGEPDSAAWTWKLNLDDASITEVSLGDLNLKPCDAIGLSQKTLHQLALSVKAGAVSIIDTSLADLNHSKAQRIIKTLGARPALPKDLIVAGAEPDHSAVLDNLRLRMASLQTLAQLALKNFTDALDADLAAKKTALHIALKWGIHSVDEAELDVDEKLQGAIDALMYRIEQLPSSINVLDSFDLARTIAEFVCNDGHYAVLSHIDIAKINKELNAIDRTADDRLNTIDKTWLNMISTVRTPVSRIEAFQLESLLEQDNGILHAWSNRPDDPWQKNVPTDPNTLRTADSRLLLVYGPKDVLKDLATEDTLVRAVGLVDSWSETVPLKEHATTAGFGFNAPSSRAPQSILLAVPPSEPTRLDNASLVQIIHETRELAHARMARTQDLAEFAGGVSTIMVPGMGDTGVKFKPHFMKQNNEELNV